MALSHTSPGAPSHEDVGPELSERREAALRKIAQAILVLGGSPPGALNGAALGEIVRAVHRSVGLTCDELEAVVDGRKNLTEHDAGQWFSRILALDRARRGRKEERKAQLVPPHDAVAALQAEDFTVFKDPDGRNAECVHPNFERDVAVENRTIVNADARSNSSSHASPKPHAVILPADDELRQKRLEMLESWWARRDSTNAYKVERAIHELVQKSGLPWEVLRPVFDGSTHLPREQLDLLRQSLPAEQQSGWELLLDPEEAKKRALLSAKATVAPEEVCPERPPAERLPAQSDAPPRQPVSAALTPEAQPTTLPWRAGRRGVAAAPRLSESETKQLSALRHDAARKMASLLGISVPPGRTTKIAEALVALTGLSWQFIYMVLKARTHLGSGSLRSMETALTAKLKTALPPGLNLKIFLNPRLQNIGVTLTDDQDDHWAQLFATLQPRRMAEARTIAALMTNARGQLTLERLAAALQVRGEPSTYSLKRMILGETHMSVIDLSAWKDRLVERCPALAKAAINWGAFLEPKPRSLTRPLGENERKALSKWRIQALATLLRKAGKGLARVTIRAVSQHFGTLCAVKPESILNVLRGRAHISQPRLNELKERLNAVTAGKLGEDQALLALLNPMEFDIGRNFDNLTFDSLAEEMALTLEAVPGRPEAAAVKLTLPPGFVFDTCADGSNETVTLIIVSTKA